MFYKFCKKNTQLFRIVIYSLRIDFSWKKLFNILYNNSSKLFFLLNTSRDAWQTSLECERCVMSFWRLWEGLEWRKFDNYMHREHRDGLGETLLAFFFKCDWNNNNRFSYWQRNVQWKWEFTDSKQALVCRIFNSVLTDWGFFYIFFPRILKIVILKLFKLLLI